MTTSLKELLAQRAALEAQIADAQRTERADAIAKIRSLMAEYGLTMADVAGSARASGGRPGPRPGGTGKVAPKYRDEATGNTWSGRGLQPRWLREALATGRTIADFEIR
ncbi:MAG: H-NS family nucleoid-associated regulatory protein [Rubrivivax sp.]|jgi:DNA-binding protein H-NS